ncbi:hypothetical protein REPUB_Repub19eG0093300 [Reevesia pubescens]
MIHDIQMIPWGGLSCCLSAATLYLLGRSSDRAVGDWSTTYAPSPFKVAQKLCALFGISEAVVGMQGVT